MNSGAPDVKQKSNMADTTPSSDKDGSRTLVPDEFSFETKAVVLNFMGMLPVPTPPTASSSSSSSGSTKQYFAQYSTNSGDSSAPLSSSWKKELPDLPELSIMERFDPSQSEDELDHHNLTGFSPTKAFKRQSAHDIGHGDFDTSNKVQLIRHSVSMGDETELELAGQMGNTPLTSYLPMKTSPKSPKKILKKWKTVDGNEHYHMVDKSMQVSPPKHKPHKAKKNDRPDTLSLANQSVPQNGATALSAESPKKCSPRSLPQPSPSRSEGVLERQASVSSEESEDSLPYSEASLYTSGRSMTSACSSYISVQTHADVDSLVRSKTLPPVAAQLRDEICKELLDLEREKDERGFASTPLHDSIDGPLGLSLSIPSGSDQPAQIHSPETQVADYLRIIGDRVNADYGQALDQAVQELQSVPREQITYDMLRILAQGVLTQALIPQSAGWYKVALLMLLGQRLTLSLLQRGEHGISTLVDYVARLIMDQAADFVISRGGWHSITEIMTPISASEVQPQYPLIHDSTSTTPSGTDTTGTTVLHDSAISSEASYNPGTLQGSATLDSIASISNEGTGEDCVDIPTLQGIEKSFLEQRRRMSNQSNPSKVDEAVQTADHDYERLEQAVQPRDSSGDYEHLREEDVNLIRQVSHQSSEGMHSDALRSQWLSLALGAAGVLLISIFFYRKMQQA